MNNMIFRVDFLDYKQRLFVECKGLINLLITAREKNDLDSVIKKFEQALEEFEKRN